MLLGDIFKLKKMTNVNNQLGIQILIPFISESFQQINYFWRIKGINLYQCTDRYFMMFLLS